MMAVIVGQKWLGAEVLSLCQGLGIGVALVISPGGQDALSRTAREAGIPDYQAERRVTRDHIPAGVDLIICAHAHIYRRVCNREGEAGRAGLSPEPTAPPPWARRRALGRTHGREDYRRHGLLA